MLQIPCWAFMRLTTSLALYDPPLPRISALRFATIARLFSGLRFAQSRQACRWRSKFSLRHLSLLARSVGLFAIYLTLRLSNNASRAAYLAKRISTIRRCCVLWKLSHRLDSVAAITLLTHLQHAALIASKSSTAVSVC